MIGRVMWLRSWTLASKVRPFANPCRGHSHQNGKIPSSIPNGSSAMHLFLTILILHFFRCLHLKKSYWMPPQLRRSPGKDDINIISGFLVMSFGAPCPMVNWRDDWQSHGGRGQPKWVAFQYLKNVALHRAKRTCWSLMTFIMGFIVLMYRVRITLHRIPG